MSVAACFHTKTVFVSVHVLIIFKSFHVGGSYALCCLDDSKIINKRHQHQSDSILPPCKLVNESWVNKNNFTVHRSVNLICVLLPDWWLAGDCQGLDQLGVTIICQVLLSTINYQPCSRCCLANGQPRLLDAKICCCLQTLMSWKIGFCMVS